jgi:2-polyprenyl-6-methoxyphenol hydroxylase-like FAD-dependent oxidoreductase
MEILDQRGLLERFEADHRAAPFVQFAAFLIDLQKLDFPHLHPLAIPQARIEEILEDWAHEVGVDVRRGHEATAVVSSEDAVTVDVRTADRVYQVRARYVVGCDGARSLVRHAAGIEFPGTDPTAIGRLGDFRLGSSVFEQLHHAVPELGGRNAGVVRTRSGNFAIVPMDGGLHRVAAIEWGQPQIDHDVPVTLEELQGAVCRVIGADLPLTEPHWMSRTTDMARQAQRYRDGRLFVAGDAAHIHFAYGGMGLQTGLQDASNLGWKLAAAIRGWAPPDLLDTYHLERHQVGERLMMSTRAQVVLAGPGEHITALRQLIGELLLYEPTARHIAELFTSVEVRYPMDHGGSEMHPMVGRFAPNLHLSTPTGATTVAAVMRDGEGVLVDLAPGAGLDRTAAPWADRVRVVTAACEDQPAPADALLIRPDGYVAWVAGTGQLDPAAHASLHRALETWFGAAHSAAVS